MRGLMKICDFHPLKRFINYSKTHFWFPLSMGLAFLMVAVVLVFHGYLQSQYLEYIENEVYANDETVLAVERQYIQSTLTNLIDTGSKLSIDSSLCKIANDYARDSSQLEQKLSLQDRLRLMTAQYSESIVSVAVIDEDGAVLSQVETALGASGVNLFWNQDNMQYLQTMNQDLREKIADAKLPKYVISTEPDFFSIVSGGFEIQHVDNVLNLAFALPGNAINLEQTNSSLVITYSMECIRDFLSGVDDNPRGYSKAYITDSQSKILYSGNREENEKNLSGLIAGKNMRILTETTENPDWKLNIVIDIDGMKAYVNAMYLRGLTIFIIAILLIVCGEIFFVRYALQPVKKISRAMHAVRDGNFENRIRIEGQNELWQLAGKFNKMADSLNEQRAATDREYQEKMLSLKKASEAEMQALQSQINAHFLCNTLNAINYSTIQEGNYEAADMLNKLSNIMQYVYSRDYKDVTLGDEIHWVEQYLALQKFRLMDVFSYKIDFPDIYREWPCCKLFLQPFVENSIKHGFAEKENGCFLNISGFVEGNHLVLIIQDNGKGMAEEKEKQVQKMISGDASFDISGVGIGLQNVAARLRLFYGEEFKIVLWTHEGQGTRFALKLPIPGYMKEEEDEDTDR